MNTSDWLRANFEPLQYAAYFGMLAIVATLEVAVPLVATPGLRRTRWPTNFMLTALNIAIVSAVPVSGLVMADAARATGAGLPNALGVAGAAAVGIGVLARSLSNYLVHVAMHKVPLLWRLHRVHHSDAGFDASTAVRFHPLEFVVQVPVGLAVIYGLGLPAAAVIAYDLLDAAMAVWTHANVRVPAWIDRPLRLVLVTPDMHRIHHASRPSETDSNYGATLSIWDRLFGTMCRTPPADPAAMQIGLAECQDQRSRSLFWLLALPFTGPLARQGKDGPS